MSELKERDARELVINNHYWPNEENMRVYLKSEADKVIAELKDSVNYNFEQFYNERKLLLHNKYRRCLDKAKICQLSIERYGRYIAEFEDCGYPIIKRWRFLKNHYEKWYQRWLELTEKFKPNKDVVWN